LSSLTCSLGSIPSDSWHLASIIRSQASASTGCRSA
jgi:hypothetical protein